LPPAPGNGKNCPVAGDGERRISRTGTDIVVQQGVQLREVLFEFRRVGKFVKVTAIDPQSNIEISMVGNPRYSQEMLKRIATRKLIYVINKRRRTAESAG